VQLEIFFPLEYEIYGSAQREIVATKEIQAAVAQRFFLSQKPYNLHTNDTPQTSGTYLAHCLDGTCVYADYSKQGCVLRNLQRSLTSMESECEFWNSKIEEDKCRLSVSVADTDWRRLILY
jgi:hypothetical protein